MRLSHNNIKKKFYTFKDKFSSPKFLLFFCVILSSYALLPILSSGFVADDALNSLIKPFVNYYQISLLDISNKIFFSWINNEGRSLLGFYVVYFLFYTLEKLLYIKIATIFFIIINISLFAYLLKKLRVNLFFIFLTIFFIIFLIEININGTDPVIGYSFHLPILFIHLLLLLILFVNWVQKENYIYLFLVSIFWLISLLFYEINIIFFPLALIISFFYRNKKIYHSIFSLSLILIVYFSLIIFLRINACCNTYDGTAIGNIYKSILAFNYQVISTLPLLNFFTSTSSEFSIIGIFNHFFKIKNILIISTVIIFLKIVSRNLKFSFKDNLPLYFGFGLLFFPAILPAISLKYQNIINIGNPALSVYYQYFGLSIILSYIFFKVNSQYPRLINYLILLISILFLLKSEFNQKAISVSNLSWKQPREIFINELKNGLLSSLESGDIIEFNTPYFVNEILIFQITGKVIINENGLSNGYIKKPRKNASKYLLIHNKERKTYTLTKIN